MVWTATRKSAQCPGLSRLVRCDDGYHNRHPEQSQAVMGKPLSQGHCRRTVSPPLLHVTQSLACGIASNLAFGMGWPQLSQ